MPATRGFVRAGSIVRDTFGQRVRVRVQSSLDILTVIDNATKRKVGVSPRKIRRRSVQRVPEAGAGADLICLKGGGGTVMTG